MNLVETNSFRSKETFVNDSRRIALWMDLLCVCDCVCFLSACRSTGVSSLCSCLWKLAKHHFSITVYVYLCVWLCDCESCQVLTVLFCRYFLRLSVLFCFVLFVCLGDV